MAISNIPLRYCLDEEGVVWFMPGSASPRSSNQSFDEFFDSRKTLKYENVFTYGSRATSGELVKLYIQKLRGGIGGFKVCSPTVCQSSGHPNAILISMYKANTPSSLGGWHEFDEFDYISYYLSSKIQQSDNSVDDDCRRILKDHVVWPLLSFIDHLDVDNVIRLLSMIIDPRWYVDPEHPNRSSRLESYLGLHPKTQIGVSIGKATWRLHDRCKLVMNTWKTKICNPANPSHFLWRIWDKHGRGPKADLKASQYFINFLRSCWSAAIYKNVSAGEPLFIPDYFFKNKEESHAFDDHLAKFIRGC